MRKRLIFGHVLLVAVATFALTPACGSKCNAVASCDIGGSAPSVSKQVAGMCGEYTGSMWTKDVVKATCPASAGATYLDGCCPLDGAIAKCIVAPGTLNERVDYYYGTKGWTIAEAKQICAGTNTKDNQFVILEGTDPTSTSTSTSSSTSSSSSSTGGGAMGTCKSVCARIVKSCQGIVTSECEAECEKDQANSASCNQQVEWQSMLDCCEMKTDFLAHCSTGKFGPCEKGVCKQLRPSGAAQGCK
jgi:hypothetical protein